MPINRDDLMDPPSDSEIRKRIVEDQRAAQSKPSGLLTVGEVYERMRLQFTVPGEPVVQPRGKPVFAGGDRTKGVRMVSAHGDHPVWGWRQRIVYEARQAIVAQMGGALYTPPLLNGPAILSVLFVTPFTGQPRKKAANPRRWHDAKKDLDNFLKPLKDALTEAGVWLDDGQIVCYGRVAKIRAAHGELPHTIVRIEPAGPIGEVWA